MKLNIQTVTNPNLAAATAEDFDLATALKNYCLLTDIEGEKRIAINQTHLSVSLDFLSKVESPYEPVLLDDDSFERLYNRFLELRGDVDLFGGMGKTDTEEFFEEDSMQEFLRNSTDILASEESAPIIKFVNSIFYQAIKKRSSDIHIEVHETKGEVRYRVDGVLIKHIDLNKNITGLVVSRIKVISNLDISEKRVPQDGRTQIRVAGKTLDIRVSILPTYYGERVVMRILMTSEHIPTLQDLGFNDELVKKFDKLLRFSHGMILVTGPTGSGKSTSLHAFLQTVVSPQKNVITVEDPVEYKADNVSQVQVNSKVGLTFAAGLRSILRQDPDVIMVGEIRDAETATIAIQAALTGHLVLSTLHTNNSTATITRLMDMGVEGYLLSSVLLGVLAQRLVRVLCHDCKAQDKLAQVHLEQLGLDPNAVVYKSVGCAHCNGTGYAGRQAIGELFLLDDETKMMLKNTVNDHEIREFAKSRGMKPLSDQLKELLLTGVTSMDEIVRVGVNDA